VKVSLRSCSANPGETLAASSSRNCCITSLAESTKLKIREVQSQKIARVIGERWKAMPEHERQIFNNLAAKDKERYKRDLDDYVRLNKQLEQSRKLQASQKGTGNVLPGA